MSEFEDNKEKTGILAVETKGFRNSEILLISSQDILSASFELGMETQGEIAKILAEKKEEDDFPELLSSCTESLNNLRLMANEKAESFTTSDGVNHLEKYIKVLENYCKGAGITVAEGALLQIEDFAGCQTLLVQNKLTGHVAGIHTEEDADEYERSGSPAKGKKWVEINLPDRNIQFCSYPGICSFGSASGVIREGDRTFFQAADIIGPTIKGDLWANAVDFMFMDCARIDYVKELVEKMKKLPTPIFNGGYVVHMVEGGELPKMVTVEFGGNTVDFIKPITTDSREIQLGVNYPRSADLAVVDDYNLPKQETENDEEFTDRIEEKRLMKRRQRRLELIAKMVGVKFIDKAGWEEDKVMKAGKEVLKRPIGDWLDEWFSGLANDLVAQNDILFVSSNKMRLTVRKGIPK